MGRRIYALVASFFCIVIFAGVTLAAWRWLAPARIDFTQNRLYTLSSSAHIVLRRVAEPVQMELVYSRAVGAEYPAIRAHAARVRELLNEIAARGNGKVAITETDPAPFSEEEDRASAAGLSPAPVDGGDPLYFGIIGRNSVDDVIAIPFLAPERDAQLEYDLVRLIAQLDDPAPPRIGVLSSLQAWQGDGTSPQDAFILREMRRAFEVVPVDPDFLTLPPRLDVLLIVHPPVLDDWRLYQIDQFMLRTGRALIALDPVSRVSIAAQSSLATVASSMPQTEAMLGVAMSGPVVADRALALPVETGIGGGRTVVEGQPLFIAAPRALMDAEDPVTADLSRAVNFGMPGRIAWTGKEGLRLIRLVESTNEAAFVAPEAAALAPAPRDLAAMLQPANGPQILAARVSGVLQTSFPNGPPAPALPDDPVLAAMARDEIAAAQPQMFTAQDPAQAVLIADADVFDDSFFVNPSTGSPVSDNAALILNALDSLAGDPALLALRSRAPAARPMQRVDELRAAARERLYREEAALAAALAEAEAALAVARTDAELAEHRAAIAAIQLRQRGVQRAFREDIDRLATQLEFINVWAPPIAIAVIGLGVFAWRSRRRRTPA